MRGGDSPTICHELYLSLLPCSTNTTSKHFCSDTNCKMKTIQEQLAEKANNVDPQPVQYIDTVEAYNKWAEVC